MSPIWRSCAAGCEPIGKGGYFLALRLLARRLAEVKVPGGVVAEAADDGYARLRFISVVPDVALLGQARFAGIAPGVGSGIHRIVAEPEADTITMLSTMDDVPADKGCWLLSVDGAVNCLVSWIHDRPRRFLTILYDRLAIST